MQLLHCLLLIAPAAVMSFGDEENVIDENNYQFGDTIQVDLSGDLRAVKQSLQDQDPDLPRTFGITDGGVYRGDLVVFLPITLLLPSFGFQSRYSTASNGEGYTTWINKLYNWGMGRSFTSSGYSQHNHNHQNHNHHHQHLQDIRGPVDRVLTDQVQYDPYLWEYQAHKDFGPMLSRLDAYFHYLGVHDDQCRMKFLCLLRQDPESYTPVSQLFTSAFRKSESFKRPASFIEPVFRFFQYYWANKQGNDGSDCSNLYHSCPANASDILNMPLLNLWQNLSSIVSIKLTDE